MSYSLKSPLKRYSLFLFLLFIILVFSFQFFVSQSLKSDKFRITKYLSLTFGYHITIEDVKFDLMNGLSLRNVFVMDKDNKPAIYMKDLSASLKIIPLISAKISVDNVNISESLLVVKKERQGLSLQIMFSELNKRLKENKRFASGLDLSRMTVNIARATVIYFDDKYRESNMHLEFKKSKVDFNSDKIKFSSGIRVKYHLPEQLYIARFFKNKDLDQDLKIVAHANIQGDNLNLGMISVNIGRSQLIGMGINKNFTDKNPFLDIIFMPSTVSLEHIPFIEDNFGSQGNVFLAVKLIGPMDDTRVFLNMLLEDCSFRYAISTGEIFEMTDFGGELDYHEDLFSIDNARFKLNDLPLEIRFKAKTIENSDFYLYISLPRDFLLSQNQFLNKFEATFNGKIKKTMVGNLKVKAAYARKDVRLELSGLFKNADFDYYNPKEKYFIAESVELLKSNPDKIQKLSLLDFKSKIYFKKNKFEIKNISFSGYQGAFNAGLGIEIRDKVLINAQLLGHRLDVKTLMRDMNITDKLLSGIMETRISFDNSKLEFLKGNLFIKDGTCNLSALTKIIKLPPLEDKYFNIMHAYFAISRDLIRFRGITLLSPEIMLNAYWDGDGKINGILSLQIASQLLNKSTQFRKLLSLARFKKAYADFKFELGGTPKAVRLMWVMGEFKARIKQQLPAWAKKSIEDSLDKSVEDLANVQ